MFSRWRKATKSGGVICLIAAVAVSTVVVAPTAATAATGAFESITVRKMADGYSFTNNPVDNAADNNIVGVHDFVGFEIDAVTGATAVSDAVITFTKPACWEWEKTVDQNLNFSLSGGSAASASATYPDSDTVRVVWNQAENGTVATAPFRAWATSACANNSTWQPVFEVTDGNGTRAITLDTVTVKSVARADLSIAPQGAPTQIGAHWFQGLGTKAAWRQRWAVRLAPETLSTAGYADPAGDTITFTVSFRSDPDPYRLRSVFTLPRIQTACWEYVSPSSSNNGTFAPLPTNQTVEITMKKRAGTGCGNGMLSQTNTLWIEQIFPEEFLQPGDRLPLIAEVAPKNWQSAQGDTIEEVLPANNTATSYVEYKAPHYGFVHGVNHFAAKVPSADYTGAWPWRSYDAPIVQPSQDANWGAVGNSNIAYQAEFVSSSFFSFDNPQLTDAKSYHFWDNSKQTINLAKLDAAVMGYVAPNNTQAAVNPALNTKAFDPATYTVECTTEYTGAHTNAAVGAMNWSPCNTLAAEQINGVRFMRAGTYAGVDLPGYPKVRHLFTMVPFKATGNAGESVVTTSKWLAHEFATEERAKSTTTRIVGNVLLLAKEADRTAVQPEETINYVVKPKVSAAIGAFTPGAVENLRVVDTLSPGVETVDLTALDSFWQATVEPTQLGADGLPYTADDVRGIRITFTPTAPVQTDTVLPEIRYTAQMGIIVPPRTAPYNSVVQNVAVVSADQSSGDKTANVEIFSGVPQATFFSKKLLSEPVIEIADQDVAWRVQWINYNDNSIGKTQFVDVFPYPGDNRGSNFNGTLALEALHLGGGALDPTTKVELTTDAPATITAAPANSVNWVAVDINNSASWPANPTALRITLPDVKSQALGFVDLRFKAENNQRDNVYGNDASGTVYSESTQSYADLGTRAGKPVRVVASSIAGIAWVDENENGQREDTEPRLPGVRVFLKRDGVAGNLREVITGPDGSYKFDNLRSGNYQVIFDPATLSTLGYSFTTQLAGGDTTIDSDADQVTGATAPVGLPRQTDITGIDAGAVGQGLALKGVTGAGSFTRSYAWELEKTITNPQNLTALNGDTNAVFEVTVTAGDFKDSAATFTGSLTVENSSATKPHTFEVALAMSGTGVVCAVNDASATYTLAAGETKDIGYTCTGNPGDTLDRIITATVQPQGINPATGAPYEQLVTTQPVRYTMGEKNKTVTVHDRFTVDALNIIENKEFGPYNWAPGAKFTETYQAQQFTVPAGECVQMKNLVWGEGFTREKQVGAQLCLPLDVQVSKNVVTELTRNYGWKTVKTLLNPDAAVDSSGKATLNYQVKTIETEKTDAAWRMSGEVTVTNPNKYKYVDVTVSDTTDIGGGADCRFAGGDTARLPANSTQVLRYDCTFTSQPNYVGTNTVTVTWMSDAAGTASELVHPKTATATAAVQEADWKLTEFQKTVTVTDQALFNGTAQAPRQLGTYTWKAAGTEHIENYSVEVQVAAGGCVAVQNTAQLTVAGASTPLGQSSADTTLCREAALQLDATSAAAMVRTYAWHIAKTFDNKSAFEKATAEKTTADFTVRVTEGAATDSAHRLTGTVELSNPNDFRDYTLELEATTTNAALSCEFVGGKQLVLLPQGNRTAEFNCVGDPGSELTGEVQVAVSGAGATPLTGTAPFEYRPTQEINKTVHIADSRIADLDWELSWSKAGTEHTREFKLEHTLSAGTCGVYDNTATVVETRQSAEVSAKRCVTAPTPVTPSVLQVTGASLSAPLGALALGLLVVAGIVLHRQRRRV